MYKDTKSLPGEEADRKISVDGQERLWSHFQNELPEAFEGAKPRLDYLIREVSRKKRGPFPRVLNVGAGNGYFETTIQGLGWDIYSLDPDEETIHRLQMRGIKSYVGHAEEMPFENSNFNFVIASEILEHLNDEQRIKGIGEVLRVMAAGGWFLGTVPYCENLLLNQACCPKCGEIFHRWGHIKSFSMDAIRAELEALFSKVSVKRRAFVRLRDRGFIGKIKGLSRLILARCGVEIAAPSIYFAAQK